MNIRYSKIKTIIILTMLSMMGLLASDIYLPAVSKMKLFFHTTEANIQLTIGVYLLGLSLFQLIYGPLSDQIGRKKIIIFGIVLYIVGSIGCSLSPNIYTLIAFRFVQSIGACAGLVIGRAVMSDIFPANEITNIYNIIYPLVAASPAIAPIIGGYLVTYLAWHSNFIFIGIFGLVLLILFINFPETLTKQKKSFLIKVLVSDYIDISKSIRFWGLTVMICCVYSAWFIYLTQSPFIFMAKLSLQPKEVGYLYIPLALSIYMGNVLSKRIKKLFGIEVALYVGCGFFMYGAIALYISLNIFTVVSALQLILPMALLAVSNGFILPLGIPSAISLCSGKSGSASGLVGFFQICFSALSSSLIANTLGISASIMSSSILVLAISSITLYMTVKKISRQQITI